MVGISGLHRYSLRY